MSTRTDAELDAAILRILANGPQMKWQLVLTLDESDGRMSRQLRFLKDTQQVKVLGKGMRDRTWALLSWQPTDPERKFNGQVVRRHAPPVKAPPPTESWWTKVDRTDFQARAQQEHARMATSTFGRASVGLVDYSASMRRSRQRVAVEAE